MADAQEKAVDMQDEAVRKAINKHCFIFEKCYTGAVHVVQNVFDKNLESSKPNAATLNFSGPDTPDMPIQALIGIAGAIAPHIYNNVIKELEKGG